MRHLIYILLKFGLAFCCLIAFILGFPSKFPRVSTTVKTALSYNHSDRLPKRLGIFIVMNITHSLNLKTYQIEETRKSCFSSLKNTLVSV